MLSGLLLQVSTAGLSRADCPGTKVEYKGRCVFPDTRDEERRKEAAATKEAPPAPRAPTPAPPSMGMLHVNSLPPSLVFVEGRPLGRTPLSGLRIGAGRHTVVFKHPELGAQSRSVVVPPGGAVTVAVKFDTQGWTNRAAACPTGMALVPGGTYRMGSEAGDSDEQPVHEVEVARFCLDLTEVTVSDYAGCVSSGKCMPANTGGSCNAGVAGRENHPINCVDWNQADAYCQAQGLRLPTEEEWEYAAKGGDEDRRYPWGAAPPGPTLLNACGSECVAWFARNQLTAKSM